MLSSDHPSSNKNKHAFIVDIHPSIPHNISIETKKGGHPSKRNEKKCTTPTPTTRRCSVSGGICRLLWLNQAFVLPKDTTHMDVLATHLGISHELQHGQPDFLVLGPSLHNGSVVLRTRRWQHMEQLREGWQVRQGRCLYLHALQLRQMQSRSSK